MKAFKILIIGGGIGGLTAAIALRRTGFEIDVFERAAVLREAGAGFALSPNAMRALDYLGLMQPILDCGTSVESAVSYTAKGDLIGSLPTNLTAMPTICLHRAELQRVLSSALPADCIHLGEELVNVQNSENDVTAHFASGKAASGKVLIGADGLRSRVRAQLVNDGEPIYRGYQCWRGVCPLPAGRILSETLGLGIRVGVVPVGLRGLAWWCTANETESASDNPQGPKAKLLGWLSSWHSPIPALIESTDPAAIIKTPIYDRAPVKKWSYGRCTLLGDAAHPTTPNMGQGGCMAIEDAIVLARCLSHYGDPATAFPAYERVRYSRTTQVTRISRYYGSLGQWDLPLAAWFRTKLLRLSSSKASTRGYLKFVNYDCSEVGV